MNRGANKRSGCKDPFPVRLHDMMTFVETECIESNTIGWVLGGRGFLIHNPEKLVEILSLFFTSTKYKSFLRQLNMWDFKRVSHGPNKGMYTHPYFVKGNRDLCFHMSRQIIKQPTVKTAQKEQQATTPQNIMSISSNNQQLEPVSANTDLGSFKSDIADSCSRLAARDLNGSNRTWEEVAVEQDSKTRKGHMAKMEEQTSKLPDVKDGIFHDSFPSWGVLRNLDSSLLEPSPIAPTTTRMSCSSSFSSSSNHSTLSTIGEILDDYAYLFEMEAAEEEEKSGTLTKMAPSSSLSWTQHQEFPAEQEEKETDDILIENFFPIGENEVVDPSCFAGKNFFLVGEDEDHRMTISST